MFIFQGRIYGTSTPILKAQCKPKPSRDDRHTCPIQHPKPNTESALRYVSISLLSRSAGRFQIPSDMLQGGREVVGNETMILMRSYRRGRGR